MPFADKVINRNSAWPTDLLPGSFFQRIEKDEIAEQLSKGNSDSKEKDEIAEQLSICLLSFCLDVSQVVNSTGVVP